MASNVCFAHTRLGSAVLLLSLACGPKAADTEQATGDAATTDDAEGTTETTTGATTGAPTEATTTAGIDEPYVYMDEVVALAAPSPRSGFTLATLPGGRALLIGGNIVLGQGENKSFEQVPATEVFTVDGGFSPGPALLHPRSYHNSAPAPDGGVLVLGGSSSTDYTDVDVFEIEHIAADGATVEVVGSLTAGRIAGKTIVEPGGTIVALGDDSLLAERFDPATGVTTPLPVETEFGYFSHYIAPLFAAARLPSGEVLLFGGIISNGSDATAFPKGPEIADLDAGTSRQITDDAADESRFDREALPLPDGDILLLGHDGHLFEPGPWLVRFDVETETMIPLQTLADPDVRFDKTPHGVLLADGRVWIVGAPGSWEDPFTLTQFYEPTTNTLTPGPELPSPIVGGAAVRLDSGPVLLTGSSPADQDWTLVAFLLK
ncbi:hypothetical protein [Nannocystis pusilla]|uniref:Kelch repeat-containing protein n=1 Tax=Nannocystis pusilla TaxID=889268 RepID=A0ABS7TR03_9BACT|nr:hypothetical protein [Nannocystis pusilla]MBZ5710659.1 hypothetical protein [Nannocystis pusilla]